MSMTMGQSGHQIELEGELDLNREAEIRRLFNSLEKDGPLTIDLRRVTYADSSFLRLLASLALRFQEVPITLSGATPQLRRVLGIVQFDKLFQIDGGSRSEF